MNAPHDNDPDISDNLRRIVPDDLSPAGLVDGARRKRNQRKSWVGAVAALAVVGLAVPLALNLPVDDAITAQPAATSKPTDGPNAASALPGAAACYNDDGTPISWNQVESAPAEPGAVKAWLCGDYAPETGMGFVGPLEPLTSGLDAIIEEVQASDEIDLTRTTCLSDYNLAFNTVFEYEDGSRRIIGGERHGCRATYDGGTARAGAEEFYGALITAWETQRETDTGDWVVPAICPGPASLIEMNAWDAVQASVCGESADGSWRSAYLSDQLVKEVAESMRASLQAPDEATPLQDSTAPEQSIWLTLSNKFTDYQTLVRHEDGMYRAYDGEGLEWFWAPPEELSNKLDEAFANAERTDVPPSVPGSEPTAEPGEPTASSDPGLPPESAPQPFIPEGCAEASSGALGSTELPAGRLPEDAARVWLCANGGFQSEIPVPPVEPLDDPDLVSQAAAAFNDLAPLPADEPCTMELGPSYLVVHEYADGTRYAVEMQEYGCMSVTGGSVVKANSALYKEKLLELWSLQRKDTVPSQIRPAPLCPLTVSMFILQLEDGFTAGAACVGAGEMADGNMMAPYEVDLSEDLIGQIAEQLTNAVDAVEYEPDGHSIVLLTKTGDPFVLFRDTDGTFHGWQGEFGKIWTPTGATAEALVAIFGE